MDLTLITENLSKKCLVAPSSAIIVGISAGPDSTALLHLLQQAPLELKLTAVYVDHGLRPQETPNEKALVHLFCTQLAIPFMPVSVPAQAHCTQNGTSLEESCRILRYEALEKIRKEHGAEYIAVGHTADDQAEEILLRLVRGTALAGLSGMRWQRGPVIRPLLNIKKQQLLQFLNEHGIPFCKDSSNSDQRFLRNRVRHTLLPLLRKNFNPSIGTTLRQTADILAVEDDFLQQVTKEALDKCLTIGPKNTESSLMTLDLSLLASHHPALQRRLMEKVCIGLGLHPAYQQITTLCDMITCCKSGIEAHLPNGIRAIKEPCNLTFFARKGRQPLHQDTQKTLKAYSLSQAPLFLLIKELGMQLTLEETTEKPEHLPTGWLALDADRLQFPLHVRSPERGERFRPSGMKGSKKIADFLRDSKIPRHLRKNYPLLLQQDSVLAILGLRAAAEPAITEKTRSYLLVGWQAVTE